MRRQRRRVSYEERARILSGFVIMHYRDSIMHHHVFIMHCLDLIMHSDRSIMHSDKLIMHYHVHTQT